MKKILKRYWFLLPLVLALALAGFVIWAETPPAPEAVALEAMNSDELVEVTQDHWIVFEPKNEPAKAGVIFYPGGRVDARAYAPLARSLAEQGYLTVIVPMPLNLAVFSPGKAQEVIAAYPEIDTWVIGGHSLGGAMAANFIYKNPDQADGLFLLAAYPASNNDLSSLNLPVVSIFGTNDGLATADKIEASRALLPGTTRWVSIEGGNHAQYGSYGIQPGDNPANIPEEEQQNQAVAAIVSLLTAIQGRTP